jgi:hypothetical protein
VEAAAATWTVKPGGATTGTAGKTVITDKTASQSVTCTSSVAKGYKFTPKQVIISP